MPKEIEKAVFKLRPSTRRAFGQAIIDLKTDGPTPKGWQVKELSGDLKGFMRLRLDYRHRVVYSIFKDIMTIEIIEVSTREGAYR